MEILPIDSPPMEQSPDNGIMANANVETVILHTKDKEYVYSGRKSFAVWMDWNEWQSVYADIFPIELNKEISHEDLQARRLRALAYMAGWRARSDVPVAVEVTAQLAEISCHDCLRGLALPGKSSYRSHEELRLLYSATIVRCVNGLVDASQKGAYAQAVSTLALRIGIPLWIVDIRHEAAHTKLPSLPTLQEAAHTLRQWLFHNYWQAQDAAIKDRVVRVAKALDRSISTLEPLGRLIALEATTLSTIAVPLLIQGQQYGQWVTADGLIMHQVAKRGDAIDMTRFEEEWIEVCNQIELIQMAQEFQDKWNDFDGCFLVSLAREIARILNDADHEVKIVLLSKWMLHLLSEKWRNKGQRLSIAAAEAMLNLKIPVSSNEERSLTIHYLEQVHEALSLASKGINHINVWKDSVSTWSLAETWTESPMGHMIVIEDHPHASDDMLKAYETSTFNSIRALVETDDEIAKEIVQCAQTSQNQSISPDEVLHLQNSIEIW